VAAADRILGVENEVERGFSEHEDPYQVADRLFTGVLRGKLETSGEARLLHTVRGIGYCLRKGGE